MSGVTGRDVVIAVLFLGVGWMLRLLWDWFVDWLYDTTGLVSSMMWDVFAVLGILVVCVGVGFGAVHYHWFTTGST